MPEKIVLRGRGVSPGYGEGPALVAKRPVAISGVGIEVETGTFRWKGHELDNISVTGKVLIMPTGLGHAGGDWALYGMKSVYDSAPKAIACLDVDLFTASGAILAEIPPVERLEKGLLEVVETGDHVRVDGSRGIVEVIKGGPEAKRAGPRRKIEQTPVGGSLETAMAFTDKEKRMLDGEHGEGVRKCMEYLIRLGVAFGASRMVPISSAHPAACSYYLAGEGALRFLEWLGQFGSEVRVPSTMNPICGDLERWETVMKMPDSLFRGQLRMNQAFKALGFVPTYSCSPYWSSVAPRFGEHVAWGEHNAVCYANSVLGARTNFEAHATAIPAAITGRIPEYGLHLAENRRAQAIVRVKTPLKDPTDWMWLGLYVGNALFDQIPVFVGLPKGISNRQLRDLVASVGPPFGKIPMIHVEGVTPEAPNLQEALGEGVPNPSSTVIEG